MNHIIRILFILFLFGIAACSSESSDDAASFSLHKETSFVAKQRERSKYLAYEHRISVALPKDDIESVFDKLVTHCVDDVANECTVLHSSLSTGEYSSSTIQLRILPKGVSPLLDLASEQGEVSEKATDVEDLQDAVVNNDKRLEMLLQYQRRLSELESSAANDIDSLIKIAQELSQVQSDIEYAQGAKAELLQRTQMDIVNIRFHAESYTSFWSPIAESLSSFGQNLSTGISQAIIALAFLLPWIAILVVAFYVLRVIWRKTRSK